MRETILEDYLVHGPRTALDVVKDMTGSKKVNLAALCLGGSRDVHPALGDAAGIYVRG